MSKPVEVQFLKDYRPVDYQIELVNLTFELDPSATLVTNQMQIVRSGQAGSVLKLNGEHLTLVKILVNGRELNDSEYEKADGYLSFVPAEQTFDLEIVTRVNPESNTALEGLYRSGGNYCTQCEAEGFRRITYFLDRPDVLSRYQTKVIADKATNPVLLSNGNLIDQGDLPNGRHFAVWEDPFKKPCYLFALVAGDLAFLEDHFESKDGRDICLRIYTDQKHLAQCRHAMDSLIHSMRWDEERFGLVYDLDIYMIVAVDDFNMGAMENKGLNIFNSKYVLANPDTATDTDFEGVEAVIAHEYFHNWTGNRVTCRDWFQLTLKEGLTVFRDQEFTADRLSPAVKRIEDVRRLRSHQFSEDAGPTAHPIQPQSYIEMNNFYTMTVYEKGAEVVRLYQTLLGRDGFRRGMDLYFERHDGQAVRVEDFRQAMADANGVNLDQMQAWYLQAGTPQLKVTTKYVAEERKLQIDCEQSLPGLQAFSPLLIPLKIGLLDAQGQALTLTPAEINQKQVRLDGDSAILQLTEEKQVFEFIDVPSESVVSLLREFSAPVKLDYAYSEPTLRFLAAQDTDSFNRWEAAQRLALIDLKRNVSALEMGESYGLGPHYSAMFEQLLDLVLADETVDLALQAYAIALPDVSYLMGEYQTVNIDALVSAHQQMQTTLGKTFYAPLLKIYQHLTTDQAYSYDKQSIARRLMKNRALSYLVATGEEEALQLAGQQFQQQANMTDVLSALNALSHHQHPLAEQCLDRFYQRWQDEPLVLDKWFSLKAAAQRSDGLAQIKALTTHPKFSYKNPNRVRSVVAVFARQNLINFHDQDGLGYAWLADQVLILDKINPQVAARMVTPFTQWQKFDLSRQKLMLTQLTRLSEQVESKDVYELVNKSLPQTN